MKRLFLAFLALAGMCMAQPTTNLANIRVQGTNNQVVSGATFGPAAGGTVTANEFYSAATLSTALDLLGSTRGSILYRGALGWTQLIPGTAGWVLTTDGAGSDPYWAVGGGGGGGSGTVTSIPDGSTNGVTWTVATRTTTPTFTFSLGAITPTTINGNTFTAGTGTLTLGAGKVLTGSNTLTFTGTDGSSVNFGTGGTVLYSGGSYVSSLAGTANQITASAATGAVTLSIPATFIAPGSIAATTGVSGTTGTFSTLTSGRVPFASTAGLLIDDADMTFAIDTLTVTKGVIGGISSIANAITNANSVTSAAGTALTLGTGTSGTAVTVASATNAVTAASTNTATSGTITNFSITPIYNQASGTAANTDLLINRTQTAVGSGVQNLVDAQVGGVSRLRTTNTGQTIVNFNDSVANADVSGSAFAVLGSDAAANSEIEVRSYGGGAPQFSAKQSNGTLASGLTATTSGQALLRFFGQGRSSASAYASGLSSYFGFHAAENWSGSANGTYFVINTIPVTTVNRLEALRVSATATATTVQGGAGNMNLLAGTGNSRTMALQTTTSGGTATTALTLDATQNALFAGTVSVTTGLITPSTTFALLNVTPTTINAFGAATTVNTGASATQIWNFGGSTTASQFRFLEPSGSGTNYTAFKAQAQSADITYTWPATVGATGAVLSDSAGNGSLTWGLITEKIATFVIDGGGSAITTGTVSGTSTIPYACTLTGWSISATAATGTNTIKIWNVATGTAIPTISNVINTSGVSLTTGTNVKSATLSDFTDTTYAAYDMFRCAVTAVDGAATDITVTLYGTRL